MSEIYKKIDLSTLPRKGEKIDWRKSIGYKCNFVYDNITGCVIIIGYDNNFVRFIYDNETHELKSSNFIRCKFGKILNAFTNEFKLKIGDTFRDDKRDLTIMNKEYRKDNRNQKWKYYKYKCNKCGWDDGWIVEDSLLKGRGCGCCSGKVVVQGINDIPTTAPWMVKYFQGGEEETKKYTCNSSKKIHPICPDCGTIKEKEVKICSIYVNKTIRCTCGDGKSYPNKFIFNILNQLNYDFETEYSPQWANGRIYDIYIPSLKLIVEMDGGVGHGNNVLNIEKEESLKIDKLKDEMATENDIKVIRIDCNYKRKDKFEYIKNNILNSRLTNYFDFVSINWDKADEYATKNIIKEVCQYYEKHKDDMLLKDICNEFNINGSVMLNYLKKGNKFGWCNYDKKYVMNTRSKLKKPHNCKQVFVVELNEMFKSATECSKILTERYNKNFSQSSVSRVCVGIQKSYKGFVFKYV